MIEREGPEEFDDYEGEIMDTKNTTAMFFSTDRPAASLVKAEVIFYKRTGNLREIRFPTADFDKPFWQEVAHQNGPWVPYRAQPDELDLN